MEENSRTQPKPRRRFLQFSLRTLLIVCLALTVFVALNIETWLASFNDPGRSVPASFSVRTGKNVLWKAPLGSFTSGNPVVSDGRVFVGTNNQHAYLDRYPASVDLGVLLCFDAKTGNFLWQHSNEKLPTGRVHDWPLWGVTSSATVQDNRLWYVSNRCELVCLDTEGYLDGEDDGELKNANFRSQQQDADEVWKLDMMNELGVVPHHMSSSVPCIVGDTVFVVTGNGAGPGLLHIDAPAAPSFIAVDKHTGKLLWSDASPGTNILHGQWGSPAIAVLGGEPQVIFPGGDGWLYSFSPRAKKTSGKKTSGKKAGESRAAAGNLLWKFDCNPKDSVWKIGGEGTRNNLMRAPTIANGLVYVTVGQHPEHGEGAGRVLCIDPTKRGDVSAELVYNSASPDGPIQHKRFQAADKDAGDFTKPNPNSAIVWEYTDTDRNGDGKIGFDEKMHRSLSRVVVHDNHVYAADFSGLVHCIDQKTGKAKWTHDMLAQTWSSPVLSDTHLFIGNDDCLLAAFPLNQAAAGTKAMPTKIGTPEFETDMRSPVCGTPTIADNVLYVVTNNKLYAVADSKTVGK